MKRLSPFLIIFTVFGVMVAFGFHLRRSFENQSATTQVASARTTDTEIMAGANPPHFKGVANAPLILEEFGDFECPACAQLYRLLKAGEGDYQSRVRVVFRHFPLSQHRLARPAAQALEAAALQGKFWEMHDKLYENQTMWSKSPDIELNFLSYARELDLDLQRFRRDQKSDIARERVEQDFQRGRSLKIRVTPTVFLNGVEVSYSDMRTVESFRRLLDHALKEKS